MRNPLLDEIFVMRPLDEDRGRKWLRYAGGLWVEDDGEADLAFITADTWGAPFALCVHLPYREGVLWQWRDTSLPWMSRASNPWHCYVVGAEEGTGNSWDRAGHPNIRAGDLAMGKCATLHGCANGRGPEIHEDNDWIREEKLWVMRTGQLVKPPEQPKCYLCRNKGYQHRLDTARCRVTDEERRIDSLQERAVAIDRELETTRDELVDAQSRLRKLRAEEAALEGEQTDALPA